MSGPRFFGKPHDSPSFSDIHISFPPKPPGISLTKNKYLLSSLIHGCANE